MRQLPLGLDFDQRQIVHAVAEQNGRFVFGLIGQGDFHLLAAADDVIIGENFTVGVNHEARAQILHGLRPIKPRLPVHRAGDVSDAGAGHFIDVDVVQLV